MPKPESLLEKETHKVLWDFKIQTDPLILARQLDLVKVNQKEKEKKKKKKKRKKRTYRIANFAVSADHKVKLKESEKKGNYVDLAREQKKTMEREGDDDTNCNWCTWNTAQR